jgi:hypothetical protein
MAGASFLPDQLSVQGETRSYTYQSDEGDMEAHFCGHCGTPLFAYAKAQGAVVVRLNSLDEPNAIPPRQAMHGEKACVWDSVAPKGPKR